MALPVIPALIAAARGVAVAGRGAFAGMGRGAAVAARRGWRFRRRRTNVQINVSDNDDDRRPSHDEANENVRQFYSAARQTLGTPNPTMAQYAQVARQHSQHQQEQQQAEQHRQTRGRLLALAKVAGAATSAIGVMTLASRDYSRAVVGRVQQLRQFDGRIGMAAARYDVGELLRTYRTASDVGGTTAALMDARRQRLDSWQPITSQMENLGNTGRIWWTRIQASVGRALDKFKVDEALEAITEKLDEMLGLEIKKKDGDDEHQRALKTWLRGQSQMPTSKKPKEKDDAGPPGDIL